MAKRSPSGSFEVAWRSTASVEIVRRHAAAPSSTTRISRRPPASMVDRDRRRAGIDGVLDEFLHGGGRPLHHLAGGDAVDEDRIEAADGHPSAHPTSLREILLGEDLALFHGRLVERIDAESIAGEDRLQHEMHQQLAE